VGRPRNQPPAPGGGFRCPRPGRRSRQRRSWWCGRLRPRSLELAQPAKLGVDLLRRLFTDVAGVRTIRSASLALSVTTYPSAASASPIRWLS
jgi:hypothetical protein